MSTIKVNTIENRTGSSITIGGSSTTSLNLASTITGGTLTNGPAFQANLSNDTSISNNTNTKVQCNSELYDTDGCYDNSTNYRFTPTVAGKYMVYCQLDMSGGAASDLNTHVIKLYKNGSQHTFKYNEFRNNPVQTITTSMSCVVDFNGSSDYVEMYALIEEVSAGSAIIQGYQARTHFGAYRLIGA